MTFEEMQRAMEPMLQHGAQLDGHIQGVLASIKELRESDQRLRESDERLRESHATLTAAVMRIADLVEDLTEAQQRTDAQLRSTDERLNAVISMVEKHITGHNHGSPAQ